MAAVEQQPLVPTVAGRAELCFKSFQHCLNEAAAIHPRELSLVEDQLARFSLWSSNIRVLVSGRGSLDYRLREAPDIQDAVIGLLEALDYRLQDLSDNPSATIDASLDQVLRGIANEINLLHKFSNTIRRASKEAQNHKAGKGFIIKDDEGNSAEPFIHAVFANHIKDQFPGASDEIRQRLAGTMLMRRKRILYRRSRYGKSIIRPQEAPSQPSITQPHARSVIEVTPRELVKRGISTKDPQIKAQSVAQTATTLIAEKFHRASTPSVVTVSKTVALNNHEEIRFPPAPCGGLIRKYKKLKQEREKPNDIGYSTFPTSIKLKQAPASDWNECLRSMPEISCPYCFCALPVEDVVDEKKWSLHVLNDLDPYVCMFQECDSPEELYSHSHTWLKHMEEHARRWRCKSKSHNEFVCDTMDEYLSHMKVAHAGKFTDTQLRVLADRNGRISGPMFKSCPLCGIEEVDGNIEHHLVGHMRLLAIKSLPSYEEDTDGLSEPETQEGSLDISRPGTRSTIKNDRYRRIYEADEESLEDPDESEVPGLHDSETVDSQSDDGIGLEQRLHDWGFIPGIRGPSPVPNDPVRKAFSTRSVRQYDKEQQIIDMTPDCAICHAPASQACDCESKALVVAVTQAEERMMGSVRNQLRGWVRGHAVDYVLGDFERRMKKVQELDSSREKHAETEGKNLEPHSQLASVNENWRESFDGYPDVVDYFFGLVKFDPPADPIKEPILQPSPRE
ncbi:hypothetical protein F5Y14DRAFT_452630 [Nemania sp. NC0429]|nr:hypothetical protein F5Y14DRAFT_452630 [Nemania sp. NC0429]